MKALIFAILGVCFAADLSAQVIFRNDFVITGKHRVKSLGLRSITVNLSRYPNFNQLVNGRGGRTLVIDVRALRNRKASYTYSEIAEKVYMPPVYTGPITRPVPAFLFFDPKLIRPRLQFSPVQR
jgi:hypothetical protein